MKPRSVLPSLDPRGQEFLTSLKENDRTRGTYGAALRCFQSFRGERLRARRAGHVPTLLALKNLDVNILADFQGWMVDQGYSLFSRRTYVAAVVAFLLFAFDKEWLPDTFSIDRARFRAKQASRRSAYPTPDADLLPIPEIITFWDREALPEGDSPKSRMLTLDILRARAFAHLLYSTAGRIGELLNLKRKDVQDGKRDQVQITGKGDKPRFLYILPDARAALSIYLSARADPFEPLFIRHHREYGTPASRQMLWETIKKAARAVGADVHPHDFRHYRASQMLNAGAPLEAIQEILGHADISTTRRIYAHYSSPAIRAIFDRTTIPVDALNA